MNDSISSASFADARARRGRNEQAAAQVVANYFAQQGWALLANGTVVWEDDHRVPPTASRSAGTPEETP